MFGRQKAQTDIKKSTQKLLDSKKDVATRLKHLKLILETVDISESKALFSTHYSHIYHLVYEGIVSAEGSLKIRGGYSYIFVVTDSDIGDCIADVPKEGEILALISINQNSIPVSFTEGK